MDLSNCPKCREPWSRGAEKCRSCGFVPIGAGLKNAPKKEYKKGKYREPGSAWGCLTFVFLGLSAFALAKYQPWTDDWEMVRAWFGQGRHHSVEGEWEVLRAITFNNGQPLLIQKADVTSGTLIFDKNGKVTINLGSGIGPAEASGQYAHLAELVSLSNLATSTPDIVPQSIKLKLAWTGPDDVVASTGGQALYMKRMGKGEKLMGLVKLGLKTGTDSNSPGSIRGAVATAENYLKEGN